MPEVLAVRLEIYRNLKKWEFMQTVAKRLVQYEPQNVQWCTAWANATRRAESIEAAKTILLEAVKNHTEAPLVHYNLACCECQSGNLEAAKQYLDKTFRLDPKYRIKALDDEDLMRMWLMLGED